MKAMYIIVALYHSLEVSKSPFAKFVSTFMFPTNHNRCCPKKINCVSLSSNFETSIFSLHFDNDN